MSEERAGWPESGREGGVDRAGEAAAADRTRLFSFTGRHLFALDLDYE